MNDGRAPVAVLAHTFPLYSLTFIAREVEELRRLGAPIVLFGMRRPAPSEVPQGMRALRDETRYLAPLRPGRLAVRHLRHLLRRPRGYFATLYAALAWGRLSVRDRLRTLRHFAEAVGLVAELEAAGAVHLHAHALSAAGSVALFAHLLGGIPFSLTAHGHDLFVETILVPEKVARARFVRVATDYNRRRVEELCGGRVASVRVAPFGVDPDRYRPAPAAAERSGPLRLLNVGRLVWEKAQHLLLRACADLRRVGIDARLTLVGEGPERAALVSLRDRLGLADAVRLAGPLPEEEVAAEYRRADIFVLSSVSEGFGVVLLEAMASGLPVIAPRLHGLSEIVDDGADGRLFRAGSAEDLAAVLRALATAPEERRRLGETARRKVEGRFALGARVAEFRRLLEEAGGGGA